MFLLCMHSALSISVIVQAEKSKKMSSLLSTKWTICYSLTVKNTRSNKMSKKVCFSGLYFHTNMSTPPSSWIGLLPQKVHFNSSILKKLSFHKGMFYRLWQLTFCVIFVISLLLLQNPKVSAARRNSDIQTESQTVYQTDISNVLIIWSALNSFLPKVDSWEIYLGWCLVRECGEVWGSWKEDDLVSTHHHHQHHWPTAFYVNANLMRIGQ